MIRETRTSFARSGKPEKVEMSKVEELEGLEKVIDAAMIQIPAIGGEGDVATQAMAILVAAKAFTRAYRQASAASGERPSDV